MHWAWRVGRLGLLFLCVVILLAPGRAGWSGTASAASTVSSEAALANLLDAVGAPLGASELTPLSSSTGLTFEIGLAPSNGAALAAFDTDLQDPSSPLYHHFLTSAQYMADFGPSPSSRNAVENFLATYGASDVSWAPGGLTVSAVLPAAQVQAAFGASLAWYRSPAEGLFYAPTGPTQVPAELRSAVDGIDGLTDAGNAQITEDLEEQAVLEARAPRSAAGVASFDDVSDPPGQVDWGTDYDGAFGALPMISAGHNGSGYSVATILWSGYNVTYGEVLPPWDPSALSQYFTDTFPSGWGNPLPNPEAVDIEDDLPPAPGQTTLGDDLGGSIENSLDLEMVGSTAPGASIYCFYFSGALLDTDSFSPLYGDFDQALSSALGFAYNGRPLAAISNSYGLPDDNDSMWSSLEETAASEGITIFASSGDAGDSPEYYSGRPQGQWPDWPSTASYNAWGVTAVGGSTIGLAGTPCGPTWTGPSSDKLPTLCYGADTVSGLSSNVVWYQNGTPPGGTAGSEGGISTVINEPTWQADSAAQSSIEYNAPIEDTHYARGIPDLSSVANSTIIFTSSDPALIGAEVAGTSVASPVMAGFMADIDSDRGSLEGFLDPALYGIGSYFLTQDPGSPSDPFGGIYADRNTADRNFAFNASAGWDPITGWGDPDIALLESALGNPTYTGFVYNPNGVPGQAGPLPGPAPTGVSTLFVFVVALILIVAVFVIILAVGAHRRRQAAAAARPSVPPAGGYAPYGYGYPAPGAMYGGGYGAPPPPGPSYPPPPGFYAPSPPSSYPPPSSAYGAPPPGPYAGAPYTAPVAPVTYLCRYCRNPRPSSYSLCPVCGAPP